MSCFPRVAAFSSAESGSGEPPDRAQICAMMMSLFSKLDFFLSRFWDRQNGVVVVETRKSQSKKWIAPVMWPRTVPNLGPEPSLVKKWIGPSLDSELKLSRRPSPEAQPAPRVHSSLRKHDGNSQKCWR